MATTPSWIPVREIKPRDWIVVPLFSSDVWETQEEAQRSGLPTRVVERVEPSREQPGTTGILFADGLYRSYSDDVHLLRYDRSRQRSLERHAREPGEPLLRERPFEDSALDQSGEGYLYYYAGWLGELFVDDRCYVLRRYEDTPGEVSFMAVAYGVGPEDDLMAPGAPQDRIRGGAPYSDQSS